MMSSSLAIFSLRIMYTSTIYVLRVNMYQPLFGMHADAPLAPGDGDRTHRLTLDPEACIC